MKILFIRHGESQDDLENRYGGWSDFKLTPKGEEQIRAKVESIKALNESFDGIYISPLLRAKRSAEILGEDLGISVEVLEYLKERNTYGILSGMEKEEAKKKYPEQVAKLEANEYVDGSERYEDVAMRIRKCLEIIEKSGKQNVIVVSHGVFLKILFEQVIKKKLTKKEDGGWVLLDLQDGKVNILSALGIEWE